MALCFNIFHRIVKARIQQKVECYEVEWQNVELGETCPFSFVTVEPREVSKSECCTKHVLTTHLEGVVDMFEHLAQQLVKGLTV